MDRAGRCLSFRAGSKRGCLIPTNLSMLLMKKFGRGKERGIVSSNMRSWFVWLIPFLVSGGMTCGALIGMSSVSDAINQEGPVGDMAGAAGALMVVICIVVGFVMATITIIVAKVLRRSAPDRIALRLCLSIVGGGIIGALGVNVQGVNTAIAWILLIGGPVLLAWSCGTQRRLPARRR